MEITLRMRVGTHENCKTQDGRRSSAFIRYIECVTRGVAVDILQRSHKVLLPAMYVHASCRSYSKEVGILALHFSAHANGDACRICHTVRTALRAFTEPD
jgi:hypothetical protein